MASGDLFFLGAGFSKAVSEVMPLLDELSATVIKGSVAAKYDTSSFEQIMTYLSQNFPWLSVKDHLRNRAEFLDITDNIKITLQGLQDQVIQNDLKQERLNWFKSLIRQLHEQQVSVISMNYDTLVESCLEAVTDIDIRYVYPIPLTNPRLRNAGILGSEETPTIKLFKLHGSINWFYSGEDRYYGETIFLNHLLGSKKATYQAKNELDNQLKDKVPFIVPPTVDKTNFFDNETIRCLWREAQAAVARADRIFFLGYSLPETDMMIHSFFNSIQLNDKKQAWVVDCDPQVVTRYNKFLGSNYKVESYSSGLNSSNPIPEFVEGYLNGQV